MANGNPKVVSGADAIFVFRNWGQNSQQATVERPRNQAPLLIPRTGTSAPIGGTTFRRQIRKAGS